jgi:putative FmdB family regulatory protein
MPIYEFYCVDCHRIFKFLSRKVDTEKVPACPRCGRAELERQVSLFAISRGRQEEGDDELEPDLDIDEAKLERAMESLAREAEGLDEDDPRQMGRLMRKLQESTGLKLNASMEEAIQRLEAGEDPDAIEESLGDVLEDENPFAASGPKRLKDLRRKLVPPPVDDALYDL